MSADDAQFALQAELASFRRQKFAGASVQPRGSKALARPARRSKAAAAKPAEATASIATARIPAEQIALGLEAAVRDADRDEDLPRHVRECPLGSAAGHRLECYASGAEHAICDECDSLQGPRALIFGCPECEYELCAHCAIGLAPSNRAADAVRSLLHGQRRVGAVRAGSVARFVCGTDGVSAALPGRGAPLAAAGGADTASEASKLHTGPGERSFSGLLEAELELVRRLALEEGVSSLEKVCALPLSAAGDFIEELLDVHAQPRCQMRIRDCASACGSDLALFVVRLQPLVASVRAPVLARWGFDEGTQGLFDMLCLLQDQGVDCPDAAEVRQRRDACLAAMYGTAHE